MTARRAIGIVRVSQTAGREGDSFVSPGEQRDRIRARCQHDGLELLRVVEELDVSGGTPLDRRHGLREAIEAVEAGEAGVIVAAYFDRLVRSLSVQAELVERVERAGGQVLALDVGQVTNRSAGQWLSGTMLGAVSEYQRRTAQERSGEAQARAVSRGAVPWANVTPGYQRREDGRLQPDPATASVVRDAFAMRAGGATIAEVRAFLAGHGVRRSYHGVQSLLESRVVLGEIHFGRLVNLNAHEAIVDPAVWRRVQDARVPRGRRAVSDRLLARLGVLVCATCGRSMIAATQTQGGRRYPFYRCGAVRQDCPRRATISATLIEELVVERVRARLAGLQGRASIETDARAAEDRLAAAQDDLDAALRAFAGLLDEQAARERISELAAVRDEAREHVQRLCGQRAAVTVSVGDWDVLTAVERRGLIAATVDRVVVAPGRGPGRVRVELFGE